MAVPLTPLRCLKHNSSGGLELLLWNFPIPHLIAPPFQWYATDGTPLTGSGPLHRAVPGMVVVVVVWWIPGELTFLELPLACGLSTFLSLSEGWGGSIAARLS